MYKFTPTGGVVRIADGAHIPNDPSNSDYAAYLRWVAQGNTAAPYVAPVPTVAECLKKIDADTDAIYGAVIGNRGEEYTAALEQAKAYQAAGYSGAVPPSVQSWTTAKNWTGAQATDDILATAASWESAREAIRASRLTRKEQARSAANDPAGRTATMSAWAAFVTYIRAQLGVS